jgi:hypothetical protein
MHTRRPLKYLLVAGVLLLSFLGGCSRKGSITIRNSTSGTIQTVCLFSDSESDTQDLNPSDVFASETMVEIVVGAEQTWESTASYFYVTTYLPFVPYYCAKHGHLGGNDYVLDQTDSALDFQQS